MQLIFLLSAATPNIHTTKIVLIAIHFCNYAVTIAMMIVSNSSTSIAMRSALTLSSIVAISYLLTSKQ